jgi:DNA polymerase elongation subunit (family B)
MAEPKMEQTDGIKDSTKNDQKDGIKINSHEYCISDFNIIETSTDSSESDDGSTSGSDNNDIENEKPVFHIQIFAKNMQGEDASILVNDYSPFFFIQVPDGWKGREKTNLFEFLKAKLPMVMKDALQSSSLHQSKTLYGFDNGKKYNFMIVRFSHMMAFNRIKNLWYEYVASEDNPEIKERQLKPGGFVYNKAKLMLYEANIPPLLRYLHIRNISPSGWVKVDHRKALVNKHEEDRKTHCAHEYVTPQKAVCPLPTKEDRPPFKKESMDIEASSSHGDFPVPVKNYKKLAAQMMEVFLDATDKTVTNEQLKAIMTAAFETNDADKTNTSSSIPRIDIVFPQKRPNKVELEAYIAKWLKAKVSQFSTDQNVAELKKINTIDKMFSKNLRFAAANEKKKATKSKDDEDADADANNSGDESGSDSEDEEGEAEETNATFFEKSEKLVRYAKKTKTIVDVLNDTAFSKDGKLTELLMSLNAAFPKLEGDIVTFIGSTFLREGEKDVYLNHCIVLNTCDRLPTPNSVVEVYDTEREVLLAWTRLMHRENPDIVMGYNIFGFDYEFMFRRSIECGCVDEFLTLSRNKDEVCGKFDVNTQEYDIERSSIRISTGTYDLSIIKMPGRLQVDMLNYFRRTDTTMSSYKLDSVASQIIGDEVTAKEFIDKTGSVRCFTKNMTGIAKDSWVHFMLQNHSTNAFNGGKKYCITQINTTEKWFEIEGLSEESMQQLTAQKVKWGLAKDDVTPKDIFRLTNQGATERAIVAKYCIQDCNLVHHLFNKVDVLTGLSEMARLCSVPMSFLVFRGQGIKLTSFLAKKCREKGVLMPVIGRGSQNDAYEGAVVLVPKTGIYLEEGVAVGDFASLYPSGMRSDNLCISSKVWTKSYDLDKKLLEETGEKDKHGNFIFDNLPGHKYVNVDFTTYKWLKNPLKPKTKAKKIATGTKTCRFEQTEGILPSILREVLKARKDTRKLIPNEPNQFMKNILNQRQLAYKVTANSIYGQTGAKTSTFYELDVAASTTAIGRKCLIFAKRIIEECYGAEDMLMPTKEDGDVLIKASYVYGDTDSVFLKLDCRDPVSKELITGEKGVKVTIEISQIVCKMVSKFLKQPHDFEY